VRAKQRIDLEVQLNLVENRGRKGCEATSKLTLTLPTPVLDDHATLGPKTIEQAMICTHVQKQTRTGTTTLVKHKNHKGSRPRMTRALESQKKIKAERIHTFTIAYTSKMKYD
jgi:ribosomal protein L21